MAALAPLPGAGAVATLGTLEAVAVWQERAAGGDWEVRQALLVREAGSLRWEAPAALAALPGDDENPSVAVGPGGGPVVAVWQHRPPGGEGDVFWSRLEPGGWAPPAPLAPLPGDDVDPALALREGGEAMAVWVNRRSGLVFSRFDGSSWSAPAPVGPTTSPSLPEVTYLDGGRALVAYADVGGGLHRVHAALWDGAAWSAAQALPRLGTSPVGIPEDGYADYDAPDEPLDRLGVGASADGGATVVWGTPVSQRNRWAPTEVRGASYDPATGRWEPLRWAEGAAGCPSRHSPDLAMTGPRDMVVAFASHGELAHARRVRGAYASEGVVREDPARDDLRPSLAPLRDRVVLLGWSRPWDGRGPGRVVWALGTLRPPAGGLGSAVSWEEAGVLPTAGDARSPEVASVFGGTGNPVPARAGGQAAVSPGLAGTGEGWGPGEDRASAGPVQASAVREQDAARSVVRVDEVVLGTTPPVVVRGLEVGAEATCPFGNRAWTTAASVRVGDGPPLSLDARTNTAIPLGAFTLRVNEQRVGLWSAEVRGLRLVGEGTDLTVGHAWAAVEGCVGTGPPVPAGGGHGH